MTIKEAYKKGFDDAISEMAEHLNDAIMDNPKENYEYREVSNLIFSMAYKIKEENK